MGSLLHNSIWLSVIFFATGYSKYIKSRINSERSGGTANFTLRSGHSDERKLPACYVKPEWHVCKYHIMKLQREFRWRAYYDPEDDECYYFRGCPDTNKQLFTFDVDCRKACVHDTNKQDKAHYHLESGRCKYFTDCGGNKKNKLFWTNIEDCHKACVANNNNKLSKKSLKKTKPKNKPNKPIHG